MYGTGGTLIYIKNVLYFEAKPKLSRLLNSDIAIGDNMSKTFDRKTKYEFYGNSI